MTARISAPQESGISINKYDAAESKSARKSL